MVCRILRDIINYMNPYSPCSQTSIINCCALCLTSVMSSLTRDYTGTPCVEDVVSITCTVPGALLEWNVPDPTRDLRVDETTELPLQRDQYTVISVVFNSTSSMITSSLSFPAVDGIIISCLPVLQPMLSEELTILTAGEAVLMHFTMLRISHFKVAPSPPNGFSDSILNSSANEVSVSVQWDPPTETGGRDDLTYTVTVSPPTQLSATVLTSTSHCDYPIQCGLHYQCCGYQLCWEQYNS